MANARATNKLMKLILSRLKKKPSHDLGTKPMAIFEPSSGGKGSKLKSASQILIKTMKDNKGEIAAKNPKFPKKRTKRPRIKAIKRLLAGPAMPTKAVPLFSFLKFKGLNGTGLA